jgi:hypothetical protein
MRSNIYCVCVTSRYGELNTDNNLIAKQFHAVSSGPDLHHIPFSAFALLPYL